ncbi:GNAT family N-acetyltransferase [Actinacidiphila sp. bgisy160]|uniref:GNAT family N-acetyltransferase n=1 Tax=Actinacidiphila sp. bgisy160 TaxID=3413796 RepID=UPI003D74EE69
MVLGAAGILTVPTAEAAVLLRKATAGIPPDTLVRADALRTVLPVAEVLGPATLAYVSDVEFRPVSTDHAVARLSVKHPDVLALLATAGHEDAGESGLGEISSPAFVILDGGEAVAAAGYRIWPGGTAHVSVLTAPQRRGRGLARTVASAAVAHALDAGLLPQWRARPEPSRRVAGALGFREVGAQLSFRLEFGA